MLKILQARLQQYVNHELPDDKAGFRKGRGTRDQIANQSSNWKAWSWNWNSHTLATDVENWLIWKDPDAGKDWRREEKGTTEDEIVNGITDSTDMSLSKLWELVDRKAWHAAVHGVSKSRTRLSDWTELI